jgi:hypothetical protein
VCVRVCVSPAQYCLNGTDTTDCIGHADRTAPYCIYMNDGECDEVINCPAGTDRTDCCPVGGTPITEDAYCGPNYPAYVPLCQYINDGNCDEPHVCDRGTDTVDCCPPGQSTPVTPHADCSSEPGYPAWVPGDDSCPYLPCRLGSTSTCLDVDWRAALSAANCLCPLVNCAAHATTARYTRDGRCDEPSCIPGDSTCVETQVCKAGTDTADCCPDVPTLPSCGPISHRATCFSMSIVA